MSVIKLIVNWILSVDIQLQIPQKALNILKYKTG